jgi:hypothetical protein
MRIKMTYEFDDDDRKAIAIYNLQQFGTPLPKSGLAPREMVLAYLELALNNQNIMCDDENNRYLAGQGKGDDE